MNDPRQKARDLLEHESLTLERLWIKYWAEGGNASRLEPDAYVHEALKPHPFELTLLAWAMEDLHPLTSHPAPTPAQAAPATQSGVLIGRLL